MAQVAGKGSIIPTDKSVPEKKCRKWHLRVSIGRDPLTKKYVTKTRRFEGTKTEAQAELRAFIRELESGIRTDTTEITFSEYAEIWYNAREVSRRFALGTLRKYRNNIRVLTPLIGNIKLRDLSVPTIKTLYAELRNHGGQGGTPLSGTSVRHTVMTLNTMLSDAVSDEIILKNPCLDKKVKEVLPKNDTPEKKALSSHDAQRLISLVSSGDPKARETGVLLALTCGLRREEICGLRWCDFDSEVGAIKVVHSLPSDGKTLSQPKTAAGKRTIPLDSRTLKRLKDWRTVQAVELLALGMSQSDTTPIITNIEGNFMHPSNLSRWWSKWRERNEFNGVSLHQLRHTFATLLVANGVDLITAKTLMGHSDTKMLTELYAHAVTENVSKATETIGSVLYAKEEPRVISIKTA